MLRLALVITELEFGGAEQCLVRLATQLDRARFQPHVCSLAGPPQRDQRLIERLAEAHVPVTFLHARSMRDGAAVAWRLRKWLRATAADVVQSMLFHANVLTHMAKPKRLPHCLGVRVADPSPWRLAIERRVAGRASVTVCVSHSVRHFLVRHGYADEKLRVIGNGIEVERFVGAEPMDLQPWGIGPERRVLLFVGRLEHQKGLDWLWRAAPKVLERLADHDLVIAGQGPLGAMLERQAHVAGWGSRVRWLGWQENIPALLARSELLVLPSRYEGMANVILESMAAERPVVVSDAEGARELLGPAAERQLVPFGDTAALIDRLLEMASNAALRRQLGQQNRAWVEQHFSVAQMVQTYAELYETLARST